MKELMDHLYLVTELSMEDSSQNLGEESFEGFFTRLFNFDPIRLSSSWKRLSRISRTYTPAMGTKINIELRSNEDDYTMDLVTRGRQVVNDLSKEVLYDISLLLESEEVLTENVMNLQNAINENRVQSFRLKDLPMFNRPLLGARSISGNESELALIVQGNEIKTETRRSSSHHFNRDGYSHSQNREVIIDRSNDERRMREAGVHWDNRKTNDVVKALYLLRPITERSSLINKNMIRGGDRYTKDIVKQLLVWQEILYEHSYFIVHRTSRLLTESN